MTSSNGNVFRVTGPLWGESTEHRWIPLTKTSDSGLWCFRWYAPEQTVGQQSKRRWFETPWRSLWRNCNVLLEDILAPNGARPWTSKMVTMHKFTHVLFKIDEAIGDFDLTFWTGWRYSKRGSHVMYLSRTLSINNCECIRRGYIALCCGISKVIILHKVTFF